MNLALIQMSPVAFNPVPAALFNNPIPIISNTDPLFGTDPVAGLSARLLSDALRTSLKADRFGKAEDFIARFRMSS